MPREALGVHGVYAHRVEADALDAELHGAAHGGLGEHGEAPEILRSVPEAVPARADEQEIRARGAFHGLGGHLAAGGAAARVENKGRAAEGGGGQLVKLRPVNAHVRRGVHVRADVGEYLQPRLAEAVAFERAALGELRLLRAGPDEDVFGYGVSEVVNEHDGTVFL